MTSTEEPINADDSETSRWVAYYQQVSGRPPRPLFRKVLSYYPTLIDQQQGRSALDLGCGDGTETLALLHQGWYVFAFDQQPEAIARLETQVPDAARSRLTTQVCRMEKALIPPVDLVYAGLSLPFCDQTAFPDFWQRIVATLPMGGRFAGHFFGERDAWSKPEEPFPTRERVEALFTDFRIDDFQEIEEDGPTALEGTKHWHIFEVIASKVWDFGGRSQNGKSIMDREGKD